MAGRWLTPSITKLPGPFPSSPTRRIFCRRPLDALSTLPPLPPLPRSSPPPPLSTAILSLRAPAPSYLVAPFPLPRPAPLTSRFLAVLLSFDLSGSNPPPILTRHPLSSTPRRTFRVSNTTAFEHRHTPVASIASFARELPLGCPGGRATEVVGRTGSSASHNHSHIRTRGDGVAPLHDDLSEREGFVPLLLGRHVSRGYHATLFTPPLY